MTTDAELEAQLDAMGATDEQRVLARQIIAEQRAAVESEQREYERRLSAFMHLPAYMRRVALAEHEGQRLQSEGADLDAVERKLFDGIARDAETWTVVRRVRELRGGRDDFGRCSVGTQALAIATLDAVERGTDAAKTTFARITTEADRFGRNRTADALRAAGWTNEDMTNE